MSKLRSDFKIDFIGIGAERSATTWIAKCLNEHPEICIPDKELFFFNEYDPHYLSVKNYRYRNGLKWLKSKFAKCPRQNIKGEFTPTYLYDKKAAERIIKDFPNVKLIVSIRNPARRAYSQYINDTRIGVIPKMSFTQALKLYKSYTEKGYYGKYMKLYFSLFPKKNILVIFYSDIKKVPKTTMKKLFKFIGVSDINYLPPSVNAIENPSSKARFQLLNFAMMQTDYFLRHYKLNFILNLADSLGIRKFTMFLRDLNRDGNIKNTTINTKAYKNLMKLYKNDQKLLRKLVGRIYAK